MATYLKLGEDSTELPSQILYRPNDLSGADSGRDGHGRWRCIKMKWGWWEVPFHQFLANIEKVTLKATIYEYQL